MANRMVRIESEVFVGVGGFTVDTCLYLAMTVITNTSDRPNAKNS